MVDAPIPRPRLPSRMPVDNAAMNSAKDELRNKLDTKNYDKGIDFDFEDFKKEKTPEELIRDLIYKNPRVEPPTMAEQETSTADRVRRIKKAGSLSIVSSDHTIEDSPNAGHVNENLGRSVAFSAVKTLGKRKGITDGRSHPLGGKRMKRRYVYEEDALGMGPSKYTEKFRQNLVKENESEITNGSSDEENSPKEKNTKPEKRGSLVTVNAKINDNK